MKRRRLDFDGFGTSSIQRQRNVTYITSENPVRGVTIPSPVLLEIPGTPGFGHARPRLAPKSEGGRHRASSLQAVGSGPGTNEPPGPGSFGTRVTAHLVAPPAPKSGHGPPGFGLLRFQGHPGCAGAAQPPGWVARASAGPVQWFPGPDSCRFEQGASAKVSERGRAFFCCGVLTRRPTCASQSRRVKTKSTGFEPGCAGCPARLGRALRTPFRARELLIFFFPGLALAWWLALTDGRPR